MPTVSAMKRGARGSHVSRPPVEKGRWAAKGTKPLPDQASVYHVLTVILVHICKRVLFIQTEVKITLYSVGLFFGSLICDFLPIPKMYLGMKENIFNVYFVGFGWGWTTLVTGTFMYLTSLTYGCGRMDIVRRQLSRLIIGCCFWYFWTQWFFTVIERQTGVCLGKAILKEKYSCIHNGFQWHAFDISGHAFLLVYINLFIVEEAKAIMGWEGIRDLIRNEDYNRDSGVSGHQDQTDDETALKGLTRHEFFVLKENYNNFTPYIRAILFMMTVISLLSDVMLTCTIIYFHTMPQKVAGGLLAISTWYATYKLWYKMPVSPGLPGEGLFRYHQIREKPREPPNRRHSFVCKDHQQKEVPMFMGMPIYSMKKEEKKEKEQDEKELPDRSEEITDKSDCMRTGPLLTETKQRSWRR